MERRAEVSRERVPSQKELVATAVVVSVGRGLCDGGGGGVAAMAQQQMSSSQKALMLELKSLQEEPVEGFRITLVDESDLYNWEVAIFGPPNTLYEGGYFKVRAGSRPRCWPVAWVCLPRPLGSLRGLAGGDRTGDFGCSGSPDHPPLLSWASWWQSRCARGEWVLDCPRPVVFFFFFLI